MFYPRDNDCRALQLHILPRLPSSSCDNRHMTVVWLQLPSYYRGYRHFTAILSFYGGYRLITAIFHYRPDHYRGVALPNKFTVELPPSCITDPTITEVSRYRINLPSNYRRLPLPTKSVTVLNIVTEEPLENYYVLSYVVVGAMNVSSRDLQ